MAKKKTSSTRRSPAPAKSGGGSSVGASKKKTAARGGTARGRSAGKAPDATGKQLVIVESPAKAKTINQYLGSDFVVQASVGHVRDLPSKAPKGSKQPVPGVDLDDRFEPTYEVMPDKKKIVTELKRNAKRASHIWFATDLDREGEAIAWHLAQELGVKPSEARRVVFNAITRDEIRKAFDHPHEIDEYKVNAQQARRILDRIVGYQVSPLLWKKVARGLSAGRVQSVAVRLIVEREREIRHFVPDEYWAVNAKLAIDPGDAAKLGPQWRQFMEPRPVKGRGESEQIKAPTLREQNAWLAEHHSLRSELVEVGGKKFDLRAVANEPRNLSQDVQRVAEAVGLSSVEIATEANPEGKGPAATLRTVTGEIAASVRYRVRSIETKRTTTRPSPPYITSTLQMAASSAIGLGAARTMRLAQNLYEGVELKGEGQVGLITYMRTDSTHLSGDAINAARDYVKGSFGEKYLPEKPNFYSSSNKAAQEAHEAIRPTDVRRTPDSLRGKIDDQALRLYDLIWKRFVACQMMPAQWDSTSIFMERSDKSTGVVLKTSGRVLVFDGHYRVSGVPTSSDEQTLPELAEKHELAPFNIDVSQQFTSPPARYNEASLVKTLEAEGIGRPSTYASIINVIQDRRYVEQRERRFYATDLGEVVTDKLIEGFPRLMDVGYTREMESQLDRIEEAHTDWRTMLGEFYEGFSAALHDALETMTHAKAEIQPAPYECPKCGRITCYRFGKNGRFLSCTGYPECDYAAPIDSEGRPLLPERVNVRCPEDGSPMVLRTGRFGPFLCSVNYPAVKFVLNLDKNGNIKLPAPPPYATTLECEKCGAQLYLRRGKRGPWLGCSKFPKCRGRMAWTKVDEGVQAQLIAALDQHEKENPQPVITTLDGKPLADGTPVATLTLPGGVQELKIHPDAPRRTRIEAA